MSRSYLGRRRLLVFTPSLMVFACALQDVPEGERRAVGGEISLVKGAEVRAALADETVSSLDTTIVSTETDESNI